MFMRTAFLFDLDGTVTTTEVLPCIASELGIADEIATLTGATINGHIEFEPSFRLRCLILGRVPIERVRAIAADIPLDPEIVSFIRARRADSFLVTGNLDVWVKPISELCGCEMYSSVASISEGNVKLERILDKGHAAADIRARGYERIVAIGDGANDVPMLNEADISIAFGGVHSPAPSAVSAANYIVHEGAALCRMLRVL